jgi:hypothetical protein
MDIGNQVRLGAKADTDTVSTDVAAVGYTAQGSNFGKDTGREGIPTAIALKAKRKLGIPLPANFGA